MQSTLGNLPEFFVVIFALNAGQLVVAETAILGSILVNALLVLGLVIIAGAWKAKDGVMRFGRRLPNDTATLLLVSSFIIVLLGIAHSSHDPASHHTKTISIVGAIALLRRLRGVAAASTSALTGVRRRRWRPKPAPGRPDRRPASSSSPSPARRPRSSRTGSSTRCSRRSTSCTSARRSPDS